MRLLFSLFVLFGGFSTFADSEIVPIFVNSTMIRTCDSWMPASSPGGGFVCAHWPRTIQVVESKYIQALERRIQDLENRLLDLESR